MWKMPRASLRHAGPDRKLRWLRGGKLRQIQSVSKSACQNLSLAQTTCKSVSRLWLGFLKESHGWPFGSSLPGSCLTCNHFSRQEPIFAIFCICYHYHMSFIYFWSIFGKITLTSLTSDLWLILFGSIVCSCLLLHLSVCCFVLSVPSFQLAFRGLLKQWLRRRGSNLRSASSCKVSNMLKGSKGTRNNLRMSMVFGDVWCIGKSMCL